MMDRTEIRLRCVDLALRSGATGDPDALWKAVDFLEIVANHPFPVAAEAAPAKSVDEAAATVVEQPEEGWALQPKEQPAGDQTQSLGLDTGASALGS